MEFTWPVMLWGLLLLPALVAWYGIGVRRARLRTVDRFADRPLFAQLVTSLPRVWRHVSMALYFVSLALLLTAVGRPVMALPMPVNKAVVVLAVDTSGSMVAPDIEPSRLEAAKIAARTFVDSFPQGP
ncbi:MAG TPA: BatA domain-containing protein, partial [bacterium]|nr:BatA domain-containing protein [bacterium]